LVRGNRFLHLHGRHDKADVVPALLARVAPGGGTIVGCGDAPNDLGLLRRCDIAVIVPGTHGPHPELSRRLPRALVAPHPHGRGWAAALEQLLTDQNSGTRP
jgi:mannosyl-3-phosphoglycerate phosphatase